MRIGILGSGLMGGKLGTIFARAGHDVVFSYARSQQKLNRLAREAGRVVDPLADENPGARLPAGLVAQQSIAHVSPFQAKARFMRLIQSSNATI